MVLGFRIGNTSESPTWMRILMMALVGIIVIVVLLMLAGVDLGIGDTVKNFTSPETTELVFWRRFDPLVPLRVTHTEVGKLESGIFNRYTMMVDMIWVNTRVENATNTYRHILHRGSGEGADYLQDTQISFQTAGAGAGASGSGSGSSSSPTRSEVMKRMPQGMPIRMNPGVMADPVTNDMIIFVDTERDNQNYRESIRIPDIPMDEPFRLALIVMPTIIEVYINCRLEATKLIDGIPREIEPQWYGLVGPAPLNAAIQNLRIINRTLGPKEIRGYCKKLPEFPDTVLNMCKK